MANTILGDGVTFQCANGGSVTIKNTAEDVSDFGVVDGWALYSDLRINAHDDLEIDISDGDIIGTVSHVTGETVLNFTLESLESNGRADLRVDDLQPEAWYRVEFNNTVARSAVGEAHKQATPGGVLQFNEVYVPSA